MVTLHVIDGLGTGGAERSLVELLPALRHRGLEPIVVCLYRRPEGVEQRLVSTGIDVRFLAARTPLGRVAELRRIIRREQPDLISTVIYEATITARLANAGLHPVLLTSLVSTSYGTSHRANPAFGRAKLAAVMALDRWSARYLTDHFHAITHTVKRSAIDHLKIPPDRITVIERGRDPDRLGRPGRERRLEARARLRLRPEQEVVVNVGRQEFPKGHIHLIDAMRRLKSRPDVVLLQAGRRGHVSSSLEQAVISAELTDQVRFLGHRDDVPDLLAAADIFAFPSLYEGLGGAVIEAMALGLPIVASDIPAMREVLEPGKNALLVPSGNAEELARAIAALLEDAARAAAFRHRSRQIFEQRFTLERCAEATETLFRRLVAPLSADTAFSP